MGLRIVTAVAILLLIGIFTLLSPQFPNGRDREKRVPMDISTLTAALRAFELDHGRYPTQEEGSSHTRVDVGHLQE